MVPGQQRVYGVKTPGAERVGAGNSGQVHLTGRSPVWASGILEER